MFPTRSVDFFGCFPRVLLRCGGFIVKNWDFRMIIFRKWELIVVDTAISTWCFQSKLGILAVLDDSCSWSFSGTDYSLFSAVFVVDHMIRGDLEIARCIADVHLCHGKANGEVALARWGRHTKPLVRVHNKQVSQLYIYNVREDRSDTTIELRAPRSHPSEKNKAFVVPDGVGTPMPWWCVSALGWQYGHSRSAAPLLSYNSGI